MAAARTKRSDYLFPAIERKGRSTLRYLVGYINRNGDRVIEPRFEEADWFFDGLAVAQVGGKWGLIDKRGNWAIAPEWEMAERISNGLCVTWKNGKRGLVDGSGKAVSQHEYEGPIRVAEGYLLVRQEDESWFVTDARGERLCDQEFENVCGVSGGLLGAKRAGLWGYFDLKQRDWRIPPTFDCEYCGPFQEGRAKAGRNGKYGFIDLEGRFVIEPAYASVIGFSEGLAAVGTFERCSGYIDTDGDVAFRLKKAWYGSSFSEGLVDVEIETKNGTRCGFVNPDGEFVIPPRFESATPFRNGLSLVGEDWDTGYINQLGQYVWKGKYVRCGIWYGQPYRHHYPSDADRE